MGAWFTSDDPARTTPSSATLSPGRTMHHGARPDLVDADPRVAVVVAKQHSRRRQIQQAGDRPPRAIERLHLEPLREREEQHDHRGFFHLIDQQGADDGDDHQGVDVERPRRMRRQRAPRREDAADEGGGDEDRRHPGGTNREQVQHAAGGDEPAGGGGCDGPRPGAGRLGRVDLTVIAARLWRQPFRLGASASADRRSLGGGWSGLSIGGGDKPFGLSIAVVPELTARDS